LTQYARPNSTISRGSWSPSSNLHLTIDETLVDDGDYTYVQDDGGSGEEPMTVTLSSVTDPVTATAHAWTVRAKKDTGTCRLDVELRQGASTVIATDSNYITTGWVDYTYTLSSAEANAITNYSTLRFKIIAEDEAEEDGTTSVSWAYFSVPDLATGAAPAWQRLDSRVLHQIRR